jgi:serine/threonine protein kinase
VGRIGPGETVGGFVIEAVAGRGGMGVVYRARQTKPDRVVALKVIAPDLADNPDFRARFERESTIAAQIEHPNVIPVHSIGEDHGILFIAMRFIVGIDLRTLITQERRLDPRRAGVIVDQVAQALDAAHADGLVHRDIKPANILLSSSGGRDHVYLTDFGLSRHVEGSMGLTATGSFLGTIDYVAPEQARADRVDGRSDVYSLGCVLFHTLSGTVPFPLENDLAKLYAHGSLPPPSISERAPDVPEAFDPVLVRAMAKVPDDRYPSAGELGRAALAAGSPRASPDGWRAPRSLSAARSSVARRPSLRKPSIAWMLSAAPQPRSEVAAPVPDLAMPEARARHVSHAVPEALVGDHVPSLDARPTSPKTRSAASLLAPLIRGVIDAIRGLLPVIYVVVGVLAAKDHHYFLHLKTQAQVLSAVLAIVVWPALLFGVDLHIQLN